MTKISAPSRVAVVTGGTGGIGMYTAAALAGQGFTVYVSGRNATSGMLGVERIREAAQRDHVHLLLGDLETREGVLSVERQVRESVDHVDVLVNNAGSAAQTRAVNADGLEVNTAVNVVAPLLLTLGLSDLLAASGAGRVVTLTGGSHPKRIDENNLQGELEFTGLTAYSHSKIIMMAVMYELAGRGRIGETTLNVCYPGQARTAMTGGVTREMLPPMLRPAWPLMKWMMRPDDGSSARAASASSVFLATSDVVAGRTCLYVDPKCKERAWPDAVLDTELRSRLYSRAMRWAQLEA